MHLLIDKCWSFNYLFFVFCVQNYYSVYGGQQFSPYYSSSGPSGNIYPYYTSQVAESGQASHHGFGSVHQFPQMLHFPVLHHQHHYASLSPSPVPSTLPTTTNEGDVHDSSMPSNIFNIHVDIFLHNVLAFILTHTNNVHTLLSLILNVVYINLVWFNYVI